MPGYNGGQKIFRGVWKSGCKNWKFNVLYVWKSRFSKYHLEFRYEYHLLVYENNLAKLQEWKRVVGILSIFDEINAEDWPKHKKINIEGNWYFCTSTYISGMYCLKSFTKRKSQVFFNRCKPHWHNIFILDFVHHLNLKIKTFHHQKKSAQLGRPLRRIVKICPCESVLRSISKVSVCRGPSDWE